MSVEGSTSECILYFLSFGPKSASELIKVTGRGKVADWNALCRLYQGSKVWRTKEPLRERCRDVKVGAGCLIICAVTMFKLCLCREAFFRV